MSIDGRENMLAANNGLHWTLPRAFLFRAGGCWGRVAEAGRARDSERRFWQGRDWACLVEYEHDQRRNRLTRRITTFRKAGRHYRRAEETHIQQLYKGSQFACELRKIGFRVHTVRRYGKFRFPRALVGLIARKQ